MLGRRPNSVRIGPKWRWSTMALKSRATIGSPRWERRKVWRNAAEQRAPANEVNQHLEKVINGVILGGAHQA